MGKVAIAALAFVGGALVGAYIAKRYFEAHGLGLVAQGVVDKIAGAGSTAGKIAAQAGDALQGLG